VLPVLARKASGIIRERSRTKDRPFFLYFPLTGPHTPWVPAKQYRGRSGAGDYGDFVVQVDDVVGQVMQALEETGLAGNTLLILTSDNGAHWTPDDKRRFPHLANAHWRGMKADIWDAGHRIPFLARWPGRIRSGSVSAQLGCLTDLLATVADIAGIPLPENAGEDSFSLAPVLLGAKPRGAPREAVVHHSVDGIFSIRKGDWKLALGLGSGGFSEPRKVAPGPGGPAGQLYNIAADPGETKNLYQQHPEVVSGLAALLEQYRKRGRSRPA
jgi:arylsulfatase A-like enzyme